MVLRLVGPTSTIRRSRALLLLGAALLTGAMALAACGDEDGDGAPETPTPQVTAPASPTAEVPTAPATPGGAETTPPDSLAPVEAARQDLATRLEREPAEIEIVSVTVQQWSDTCLEVRVLEQPDEVCAQVITPGFEVVLRLEQTQFTYHTDETGANVRFADVDIGAGD